MSSIPAPRPALPRAQDKAQGAGPASVPHGTQGVAASSTPEVAQEAPQAAASTITPAATLDVEQGAASGADPDRASGADPDRASGADPDRAGSADPDHPSHSAALPVTAGLAAVLLVALALPATSHSGMTELPRWLIVAAIVFATLTVMAAVGTLRSRRALPATVTGLLLVAATVLTGSAAVVVLAGGPAVAPATAEGLTVSISGVGEAANLTMRAELPHVAVGDVVRAEVTGGDGLVLARQLTVARGGGPVTVTLEAPAVGAYDSLQVLVESPDRRCTANLRPTISEAPVASCKAR